ncbi:P-loop containing nucleoside triphosphate hydrolase protein [Mycena rosella]|uniref:P-loop containing nucleoside triphosphate hydrolase protein n=1 Tax=Mycena rosella TaxID=1033263 RepID=A0AAD7CD82_MYCRO|nr:P-loop containing nucleoside triphosphate hydrolase protein [Mycena rosella]
MPPPVPGFGLYYSENVSGSEKTAAPPIPREKKNSFSDAKFIREFKIVVLGSFGGGKTQLIERFIYDTYTDDSPLTIEDFYRRQIFLDDEISLLDVTDTTGSDLYESMHESWIRPAEGFILAFSLTSNWEDGLKEMETFRDKIYRIKDTRSVPIVAVGLKSDLSHERQVDAATIESLSTQWNIPFYETSAKLNWHVNDVFEDLLRQLRLQVQYASDPDLSDPVMKRRKRQQGSCIIM